MSNIYTDDDIRAMRKVTTQAAANYLGISAEAVKLGLRNALLPVGFAAKEEGSAYSANWTYAIVSERLIAYKHGTINEIQVKNIETSLTSIISSFEDMKHDLLFLLKEGGKLEG